MNIQNPQIYYCETSGGTPIDNGGETASDKVLLIVRDGPAGATWEMVRNRDYVKTFVFNSSGEAVVPMENLDPEMNLFQLRAHSSALPVSDWVVFVRSAGVEVENFDSRSVQTLNVGQVVDISTMQLLLVKGPSANTGVINVSGVPDLPGQLTGNMLYIHHEIGSSPVPPSRRLRITLRKDVEKFGFNFYYPPRDSICTIFLYKRDGSLLRQENLPPSTGLVFLEFSHSGIAVVELEVGGTCYIAMDYFRFSPAI